ncbi:MAG TPA: hypothetical protein VGO00_21545, partial [Kofleriaceae bacterium]|nr:hypothetical protein [Kofleriaceae bacterium]
APNMTIETLALSADGDAIWAGGAADGAGAVRAWDIGVEQRPPDELAKLVDERVPWTLSDEGVVTLKSERGDGDGQR